MASEQQDISILLVSQRTISAELFAQELGREAGFRITAHVETTDESVRAVRDTPVDVALINLKLKDGPHSGLNALQRIAEARPGVRSVILLEQDELHLSTTAFRAGAKGVFYTGNAKFESLCHCVKQVNAGQIWANSAQLEEVMGAFSRPTPHQIVSADGEQLLTKREAEIARLVEEGMTNRKIANELDLSEHTVRNNLFHIFDKLGISTRLELALYAVNQPRDQLVKLPSAVAKEAIGKPAKGVRREE